MKKEEKSITKTGQPNVIFSNNCPDNFTGISSNITFGALNGVAISTTSWRTKEDVLTWATIEAQFYLSIAERLHQFAQIVESGKVAKGLWREESK